MTLDECKAACSLHASCEGVIVPAGASGTQRVACFRKARLRTRHCQPSAEFDLHARTGWSRAVPVGTHASGAAMPLAGRLTSDACDAMLANKDDKLWAAFGQGPTVRQPLEPPCFGVGKEAGEWWELALQGRTPRHERMLRGCDVNWAGDPWGRVPRVQNPSLRPLKGPALLGFDMDILDYCSEQNGHLPPGRGIANAEDMVRQKFGGNYISFVQALINECHAAGVNFLRVGGEPGWNMCANTEWQTCAATGKLPNQPSNAARFAPPPKHVRLEEVRDPPEACICTDKTKCPDLPMFCPDAYTFEVCYFNHVCKNRDALFAIETGDDFLCEFDAEKYRSLKDLLAPPPPPPPLPPPPPPPPPPPQPPPDAWILHERRNCWWDGHGAEEVDYPRGSSVPGVHTLEACQAACESAQAVSCEATLFNRHTRKCYRKTSIIVGLCLYDPSLDLHLRTDLISPPPPPQSSADLLHKLPPDSVVPRAGPLNVGTCNAILRSSFPWNTMAARFLPSRCLPYDRAGFFNDALSGVMCDANWIAGSQGPNGQLNARPMEGPVILGYDTTIVEHCLLSRGIEPGAMPDLNSQSIVDQCLPAHFNFIRVFDWWSYCRQVHYILCAMQGKLPGQPVERGGSPADRGEIQFAKAPRELRVEHLWHVPYNTVADVYFFEVCMLSQLCKNRDKLFEVGVLESFFCELDLDAYNDFAAFL